MLLPTGPRSLAFTREVAASLPMLLSIGIKLVEVPSDNDDADFPSFSALPSGTVFWYHGAERLLRQDLVAIMS